MAKIRAAIIGVGNCASSLVQGVSFYRSANDNVAGVMHRDLGGYEPSDVDFVLAYDIDKIGVMVKMGSVLDGMADPMEHMPADRSFARAKGAEPNKAYVAQALIGPFAFFCKHPPVQYTDDEADRLTETFIAPEMQVAAQ